MTDQQKREYKLVEYNKKVAELDASLKSRKIDVDGYRRVKSAYINKYLA